MNTYVLDANPITAARFHNDRHVIKMILESCQLLVTAHATLTSAVPAGLTLRPATLAAHVRHPCARWARSTGANYAWLHGLATALCAEFAARYGHPHSYMAHNVPALAAAPVGLPVGVLTPHPQCMPEPCKVPGNEVAAYRNYYRQLKPHMTVWYLGDPAMVPPWFKENT